MACLVRPFEASRGLTRPRGFGVSCPLQRTGHPPFAMSPLGWGSTSNDALPKRCSEGGRDHEERPSTRPSICACRSEPDARPIGIGRTRGRGRSQSWNVDAGTEFEAVQPTDPAPGCGHRPSDGCRMGRCSLPGLGGLDPDRHDEVDPLAHFGSSGELPRTAHARATSRMDPSASTGSVARKRSRRRPRDGSSRLAAYPGAGPTPLRNGVQ